MTILFLLNFQNVITSGLLNTKWIQKDIVWKKLKSGEREVDKKYKSGKITSLCFNDNNTFLMSVTIGVLSSENDSINIFSQPFFHLYKGIWREINANEIKVEYKSYWAEKCVTDVDTLLNSDNIILKENQIIFRDQIFIPADKVNDFSFERLLMLYD